MDLLKKTKQFAVSTNNVKNNNFTQAVKLADKIEKKFGKIAQIVNVDTVRQQLVNLLKTQWTNNPENFPIEARNAMSPLMYPQGETTLENLLSAARRIYAILFRSKDQNTKEFSEKVFQLANKIEQLNSSAPSIPAPTQPTDQPQQQQVAQQPAKPKAKYPSIPKDIQQKLNYILASGEHPEIVPLIPDGILGPETQRALKVYKNKYDSQNLSLQQLFSSIRKHDTSTVV